MALRMSTNRVENGDSEPVSIGRLLPSMHESQALGNSERVLAARQSIRWPIKCHTGSHKTLARDGYPDLVVVIPDGPGIDPRMLSCIAKNTDTIEPVKLAARTLSLPPRSRNRSMKTISKVSPHEGNPEDPTFQSLPSSP